MLLKTPRIWSFRALTNRGALIGCRLEIGSDFGLVEEGGGVPRMRIVLGVMLGVEGVCSRVLPIEHLEQVVNREVWFLVFWFWLLRGGRWRSRRANNRCSLQRLA